MGVNKVDFAGNTLIDLTSDTVTAESLLQGFTAHGADGEMIQGILEMVGMPDNLVAFNHGSHTPTSDKSVSVGIKHGLGTKPTFVIFYTKEPPTSNGFDEYMVRQFIFSQDVYRGTSGTTRTTITIYVKGNGSAFASGTRLSNLETDVIDDEYFHIFGNSVPLKAGATYNWFAGVLEEL